MGKKNNGPSGKKKLTKKEKKALNHAKLMNNKKDSNVIEVDFHQKNDSNKKAA